MSGLPDEGSSFSDYAEIAFGLYVGAHPEPEDPFELGATVVVCLAPETSVRSVRATVFWSTGRSRTDRSRMRRS